MSENKFDYKNIRKNLAESLIDDENRKKYFHPKTYSTLEKLAFAYEPVKNDFKLKLLMVAYSLSTGFLPIISAFILYFLVEILTKRSGDIKGVLFVTTTYGLVYSLLSIIKIQIKNRNSIRFNELRIEFFHKCIYKNMTMDFGLLENSKFMDDMERFYRAFQSNNNGLEGSYRKTFELGGQFISLLLLGLLLFYVSPIIFLASIFCIGILVFVREKTSTYKHKRQDKLNSLNRKVSNINYEGSNFQHGKDLRLYGFKNIFLKSYKPLTKSYEDYYRRFTKVDAYIAPVQSFAIVGLEGLAYLLLVDKIFKNQINLASLALFISAVTLFITKVNELAESLSFIKEEMLYFQDGIDIIKANLNSEAGNKTLEDCESISIEFQDVSFSYPNSDKLVLDKLNFKLEKKKRLALVGVNGAGKSTVVKLITGLLKPISGKILINGIDAEELSIESRFKAFSVVLQEVEPLAMSIAENVAAKVKGINRDKVKMALERAGLGEKIQLLEKGIDTQMTKIIEDEGTLFSGGENQKLAIARALYKDSAKAMIFDEPTAALDALAEEKIYKELGEIVGNKSLIFISHRLASTKFCDKIALLDGGSIKEFGSHEELMKENGLYKKMFETQGKYYKEGEKDNEK